MVTSAATANTHQRLRLADGRQLGYAEFGDPQGHPVFFFHGLPGSRLQGHPDRSIVAALGIRLIAIDRPGYGLSDYQPGRTLLDWPTDTKVLARHLGLPRFAVLGVSGGGPYAAACAWKIPEYLTGTTLVSSMGPTNDAQVLERMPRLNRWLLRLARRGEWPVRLPATILAVMARHWPGPYLAMMNAHLPPADRAVYELPEVQALIREDLAEAFRQGGRGAMRDIILLSRPWGFSLQDIQVPVQLWHGEQDITVPVPIGHTLANAIARCQALFVADAGHFLIIDHWQEILLRLLRQINHQL